MPLITVIMASYYHAEYLPDAIESVLNQTFPDLELIIIDDASQDTSRSCIERYALQDERIRAVFHDTNHGIAYTANQGLALARGKYIAFIDSDDVWIPDKLQRQLDILALNEDIVVWSEGLIIDEKGIPTGETFTQVNQVGNRKKSGDIFEELIQGNYIFGSSMVFKKENLHGIRFNEKLKYLNDFQFNVDLAETFKFHYIPEPLAFYRVHERNTIKINREGHYWDYPKLGEYFLSTYGDQIQNCTRLQIFLASLDHLKKIIYRREGKIDEITEYTRSLEDAIHQKDAEITSISSYARSLEDAIHQKDAEITSISSCARSLEDAIHQKDAEITSISSYARSLEDAIHQKDTFISELNSHIQQVTEYSLSLEDQMEIMKGSFIAWLKMRKKS